MKNKKVNYTIIIPAYNCALYLHRCINSVLNQKYSSIEVILIDDGSTDESGIICDEYSKKNNSVKVIHIKNSGVSHARNIGLKAANGKYICFLDSDDYLSDNYFITCDEIINKHKDIELLNFGFYSDVDDINLKKLSSDVINYNDKLYQSRRSIKNDFVNLWDKTMLYNIWNKVYLKSIIDKNNIFFANLNWGEDVDFNKKYLNVINCMYNSSKCFYHYIRERDGAATKKYKPEIFEIRKKEFFEFNYYFESWNIPKSDYYEFSCRRYIERILGCIENTYCSKLSFLFRYKEIKRIINDSVTIETLKYIQPKSKKVKIMLIPIKLKSTLATVLMAKILHEIKTKFPGLFNKLKNRR